MVRAKFRVTEVTTSISNYGGAAGTIESKRVKLSAVGDEHNKTWSKWTPSGELTMTINNPAAFEQFKPGQCYFVDFVEAPAKEADEGKAAG
jgi:hypothetical protein